MKELLQEGSLCHFCLNLRHFWGKKKHFDPKWSISPLSPAPSFYFLNVVLNLPTETMIGVNVVSFRGYNNNNFISGLVLFGVLTSNITTIINIKMLQKSFIIQELVPCRDKKNCTTPTLCYLLKVSLNILTPPAPPSHNHQILYAHSQCVHCTCTG